MSAEVVSILNNCEYLLTQYSMAEIEDMEFQYGLFEREKSQVHLVYAVNACYCFESIVSIYLLL